jgi:hypothetical protein
MYHGKYGLMPMKRIPKIERMSPSDCLTLLESNRPAHLGSHGRLYRRGVFYLPTHIVETALLIHSSLIPQWLF